jgi:hypothetical protein
VGAHGGPEPHTEKQQQQTTITTGELTVDQQESRQSGSHEGHRLIPLEVLARELETGNQQRQSKDETKIHHVAAECIPQGDLRCACKG